MPAGLRHVFLVLGLLWVLVLRVEVVCFFVLLGFWFLLLDFVLSLCHYILTGFWFAGFWVYLVCCFECLCCALVFCRWFRCCEFALREI